MSYSYTLSNTQTFSVTNAKYMASKVAADLKRMQRLYGSPSDAKIAQFEEEITQLLKGGYLDRVMYGFKRDGSWIEPTLRYTARDLAGGSANDDDPGKIRPGADVAGASFYSYLVYSSAWDALTSDQRQSFKNSISIKRGTAEEPGVNGYFSSDRMYSSGGRALDRSTVRSY